MIIFLLMTKIPTVQILFKPFGKLSATTTTMSTANQLKVSWDRKLTNKQMKKHQKEKKNTAALSLFQSFPRGILRRTGNPSSGRRIRWNEEQLATKEEKGVMHSSGRQSRSICALDQLILHVTELQNLRDAEETLLAANSGRRRSNRSKQHSIREVMSHQGYLC